MVGRYGVDELNIFLIVLSLVLMLVSKNSFLFVLNIISWILLIFAFYRMYSRNITKRYAEKMKYLSFKTKVVSWYRIKSDAWRNRKTHKYFRCKDCKASIRVPRGVGKVEVTCPKCKQRFIKKV